MRALSSFRGFSSRHAEPDPACSASPCALSFLLSCASPMLCSCSALICQHWAAPCAVNMQVTSQRNGTQGTHSSTVWLLIRAYALQHQV